MKHELKIWPEHFHAIADRRKRFEVRSVEDRSFDEGDTLHLREWMQDDQAYTGREMTVRVDLVHAGIGTMQGFVVMSISITRPPRGMPCHVMPCDEADGWGIPSVVPTLEAHQDLEARVTELEKFATFTNPCLGEPWPEKSKPIPGADSYVKRKAGRLVQVFEYLCKTHRQGHTQAALRGALNSDARIVTATVEEGRRLGVPFLSMNHPKDWTTSSGPLVFDSSTVEVLLAEALGLISSANERAEQADKNVWQQQRSIELSAGLVAKYEARALRTENELAALRKRLETWPEDLVKAEARVKELEAQLAARPAVGEGQVLVDAKELDLLRAAKAWAEEHCKTPCRPEGSTEA